MAAVVSLIGGPCDGQNRSISDKTLKAGRLTCQGTVYIRTDKFGSQENIVFATRAAISGGTSGTPAPNIFQSNVYRSWGDIQRSANRNLPTALHRITVSQTRLLQTLTHKRRVRR